MREWYKKGRKVIKLKYTKNVSSLIINFYSVFCVDNYPKEKKKKRNC